MEHETRAVPKLNFEHGSVIKMNTQTASFDVPASWILYCKVSPNQFVVMQASGQLYSTSIISLWNNKVYSDDFTHYGLTYEQARKSLAERATEKLINP